MAESICCGVDIVKKEYNIEWEYAKDRCVELLDDFTYTSTHAKIGDLPKVELEIKGSCIEELRFLKKALEFYVEYLDAFMPTVIAGKTKTTACIFEGSFDEFKSYTGPKWRNIIQAITRKRRKSIGKCECCGLAKPLDAAHKTGMGRNDIIKDILDNNYATVTPNIYRVDLDKFEAEFRKAHQPLEDAFFFLCKDCHNDYDGKDVIKSKNVESRVLKNRKNTSALNAKAVSNGKNTQKSIGNINSSSVSASKRNRTGNATNEQTAMEIAADYLHGKESMRDLEKKHLNIQNPNGYTVMDILKSLGITGKEKSLLKNSDIDTAISNASGILKDTLIKIKTKGL